MDLVTHGLLGALIGKSLSKGDNFRLTTTIGCVAALLPDLDVLIQSASDPLLQLEYHRYFSHSLLFGFIATGLITLIGAPFVRHKLTRLRLFSVILTAYYSACLVDACTSYGTHLFWPFTSEPIALAIIAVVDPVFAGLLLISLITSLACKRRHYAWLGLLLACCYLGIGWLQHQRAQLVANELAQARGDLGAQIEVKPTIGNLLLWRALTINSAKELQVDALRLGFKTSIYTGEKRALINLNNWHQVPQNSRAYHELERFQRLSQALLMIHSQTPLMIGDARFAMLPTSVDPIWGIEIDISLPDDPIQFSIRRTLTTATRAEFSAMLMGQELANKISSPLAAGR